jgi:hypothetical protein
MGLFKTLTRVFVAGSTGGLSEVPHQFKVAAQIARPLIKSAVGTFHQAFPTAPTHDQTLGQPVQGYQYPYTNPYQQTNYGGDPWAFSTPSQASSLQSPSYQERYRPNSAQDWESLNLY